MWQDVFTSLCETLLFDSFLEQLNVARHVLYNGLQAFITVTMIIAGSIRKLFSFQQRKKDYNSTTKNNTACYNPCKLNILSFLKTPFPNLKVASDSLDQRLLSQITNRSLLPKVLQNSVRAPKAVKLCVQRCINPHL